MKKTVSLFLTSLLLTTGAFYVQHNQHADYAVLTSRFCSLQQDLKNGEENISFLNTHSSDIDFLTKKGWFRPHSRLVASETIRQAATVLSSIHFTFEPEAIHTESPSCAFKVTKIILEAQSVLDTPLYDFLENLLKTFPGVLLLRKLSLSRHGNAPFIHGEIILEWIALAEEEEVKDAE